MGYYFSIDVQNSFLLTRSVCLFILRVSNLRGKAMIEDLVKCPKEILRKKKPQYKVENRHKRMDVSLSSNDGNTFTMFIRISLDFPEDFSVGLKLEGPNDFSDTAIVLVRFQGPHGAQSETRSFSDMHNSYHVHLYSNDDASHCRRRASVKFEIPACFSSIDSAIAEFLEYCAIRDIYGIFEEEKARASAFALNFDDPAIDTALQ